MKGLTEEVTFHIEIHRIWNLLAKIMSEMLFFQFSFGAFVDRNLINLSMSFVVILSHFSELKNYCSDLILFTLNRSNQLV